MNIINNTLAKHGLRKNELPQKVINRINYLEETQEELDESKADLKVETDEEVREEMIETIAKAESYLVTLTEEVVEMIKAVAEAKKPAQTPQAPAQNVPASNQPPAEPKKKGSALPWLVGGVLLVLTLGAVNIMQEK